MRRPTSDSRKPPPLAQVPLRQVRRRSGERRWQRVRRGIPAGTLSHKPGRSPALWPRDHPTSGRRPCSRAALGCPPHARMTHPGATKTRLDGRPGSRIRKPRSCGRTPPSSHPTRVCVPADNPPDRKDNSTGALGPPAAILPSRPCASVQRSSDRSSGSRGSSHTTRPPPRQPHRPRPPRRLWVEENS